MGLGLCLKLLSVSDEIGQFVSDKVGQSVSDEIGQSVSDEIGQSVSDEVGQSVSDEIGQSVSDEIGQSVSDEVGQSVSDEVGQSVSDEVGQSVSDEIGQFSTKQKMLLLQIIKSSITNQSKAVKKKVLDLSESLKDPMKLILKHSLPLLIFGHYDVSLCSKQINPSFDLLESVFSYDVVATTVDVFQPK